MPPNATFDVRCSISTSMPGAVVESVADEHDRGRGDGLGDAQLRLTFGRRDGAGAACAHVDAGRPWQEPAATWSVAGP